METDWSEDNSEIVKVVYLLGVKITTRFLQFYSLGQMLYNLDLTVLFTNGSTWKRPSFLLPTTCKQFQFYSQTYSLGADAALFVD